MANDTTLTVVGNLTADPDLRFTSQGVALLKFTIASTPRYFDKAAGGFKDGDPLFLPCTAWRELAENAAESLHKGTRVIATGRLVQSTYTTEAGDKRTTYTLHADDIGVSVRFHTARLTRHHTTGGNP